MVKSWAHKGAFEYFVTLIEYWCRRSRSQRCPIVNENNPMTNLVSHLLFNEVSRLNIIQLSFDYVLHTLQYKFTFMFLHYEYNTQLHKHLQECSFKSEWVKWMDYGLQKFARPHYSVAKIIP